MWSNLDDDSDIFYIEHEMCRSVMEIAEIEFQVQKIDI